MSGRLSSLSTLHTGLVGLRRPSCPGDAVRLLDRCGRTYAAGIRAATLVPTVVVALLAAQNTRVLVPAA